MFTLRPYQQDAVDAAIQYLTHNHRPALIVAATGAGKSLIVAEVAKHFGTAVVLHPSSELCEQNARKYEAYDLGNHSIFCAGLGAKDASGDVIFATHQSIQAEDVPEIKILIIDEAHKFTKSFQTLYGRLRKQNPALRVLGLTATPYLMGAGFIYQQDATGRVMTEQETRAPFFARCVYEIDAEYLIEHGYLSPLTVGIPEATYDCSEIEVTASGWITDASLEKATTSDTHATAVISRQLVEIMRGPRFACMAFTSSISHAESFMSYLPPGMGRLITGDTHPKDRARWLAAFKVGMFPILVNVATLTTGVDLPLVDVIAILRPTDSAALWQQIAGRGMRLCPELWKEDCLLLDFTENLETFFPSGNVYRPEIHAIRQKKVEYQVVVCPTCSYQNRFAKAPNEMGLPVSEDGYFLDLTGKPVIDPSNGNKMIAHHGRRCQHLDDLGERCEHRFIAKVCPTCGTNNDIAASKCGQCSADLVDWNRHLKKLAQATQKVVDRVGEWSIGRVTSVELDDNKSSTRGLFYVERRKKPIIKWLNGTPGLEKVLHEGRVPHAIAWRKNLRGYQDVRIFWGPLDLDAFMEKNK